jgi:hypothetical protein
LNNLKLKNHILLFSSNIKHTNIKYQFEIFVVFYWIKNKIKKNQCTHFNQNEEHIQINIENEYPL